MIPSLLCPKLCFDCYTCCADACPVACIHPGSGKNAKNTDWYWIDFTSCIDCGICLQLCPVEGAIIPEMRLELQQTSLSK